MKNLNFIALLAIALFAACKKDAVDSDKGLTAAEFKKSFSVPTQTFNGTAGTIFTITGAKGIKIEFPATAFLNAAGNPVTGAIKLSLVEVLSKRDIVLSGKTTVSNGQLLITGGQIEVRATQNGQALRLNPAVAASVKVPTVLNTDPMQLFTFGATAVSDSTWTLNQKGRVALTQGFYEFSLPDFGWINCDYFYSNPNPKTTITASPAYSGAAPSIKNQTAYLVFDTIKSVAGLPFDTSINKHQSYLNSMPIGLSAELIIIAIDVNDVVYFGHTKFTVGAGLHVNAPMLTANQIDIDNYLNSL